MASVKELTDPLREIYLPVPPAGPGVCVICHTQPGAGYDTCYRCHEAMAAVTHPLELVVPISLTVKDGQLYSYLVRYKSATFPPGTALAQLRRTVAAIIGRFLQDHAGCIEERTGTRVDTWTIVPSTRDRVGAHPLEGVIRMLTVDGTRYVETLRAKPGWSGGTREAADDRFEVITDVRERGILIIDDTFTTGSRMQSAASALTLAGARVLAGVPIGRLVNAEYSPDVLDWAEKHRYDFDRCCLEYP